MSEHVILDAAAIARTLTRLSHEVVEKTKGRKNSACWGSDAAERLWRSVFAH